MKKEFGEKVQRLRQEKGLTREELCGDEIELSVRQLARIESGQSLPTLAKVQYISEKLGVSVGSLTDGENLELPKRYKELKYQILRLPTYADEERLQLREEQFDEILNVYYDHLPEVEQVMVDILQSRFEVFHSGNVDFGTGILEDYFEQLTRKKRYQFNDIILIDLYLMCGVAAKFSPDIFDQSTYDMFVKNLIIHSSLWDIDELFLLNKVLLNICSIDIWQKNYSRLDNLLTICHDNILRSQDFQCMPLYFMYRWEHALYELNDEEEARRYYQQAIVFSEMTQDTYLIEKLKNEWKNR